jgi:hypothetical protein
MKKQIVQTHEKLFRIWSERRDDTLAVRLEYTVAEQDGCKVFTITNREDWD